MILRTLGFYRGKCDGIWSKQTIRAKQDFEKDPKFKPAYPNNGMPFDLGFTSPLPTGVYVDPQKRGMLKHDELTQDKINEWSGDLVENFDNRKDTVKVVRESEPEQELEESKSKITSMNDLEELESDESENTVEEKPKPQPHSNHTNQQRKKHRR